MPEQTYNIGYGKNDFFYNKNNSDILNTIPFEKETLITWVNTKGGAITKDNYPTDMFDPRITKVVFDNKDDFIKNYLSNNIKIDSNRFIKKFIKKFKSDINVGELNSGYIKFEPVNSTKYSNAEIDLYVAKGKIDESSSIKNTANTDGQINSDISLKAVLSPNEIPFNESDGSTSYISTNTANPRCKFQSSCTQNHWHYAKCETQTFTNADGTTYCKCVCTGERTRDNTEHQHCSPYMVGTNGDKDQIEFQSLVSTLIKQISVSFKQQTDNKVTDSAQITFDESIRTLIYDYYYELNRNNELQKKIISRSSLDNTTSQALQDANVKYKKEYLHLFNIFSGILFASGYIYVLYKSK